MPVNLERARNLIVTQGLAFVCAMCEHYHDAHDKGLKSCGKSCGGPFAGSSFPHYKGPLPEGDWVHFCFMCGCPQSLTGVRVVGADRLMATCPACRKTVSKGLLPVEEYHPKFPAPILLISGKVNDAEDTGKS